MKKQKTVLMTEGPIIKQIIGFALPIFLGNLLQQLYNMADTVIVGKFVGDDALAAVSSSGNLIFLFTGLIIGIFNGAGVVIAQNFGAGNNDDVDDSIHTTVALSLIFGVLLIGIGTFLPQIMLRLMGTPENILPLSVKYFKLYFTGSIGWCLYNSCSAIFQAMGDSRHPVYYLITSALTNIVLDIVFITVFDMGVAGAALATSLSLYLSGTLSIIRLTKKDMLFYVSIKRIKLHAKKVGDILKMGIPAGIQNSVIAFANVIVQSNINKFGDLAMAGCGSYSKLEGFAFLPVTSFSMALTTFVGQNFGAKKYDRVKKGSTFGILTCAALAEVIGLIMFIGMPLFMRAFTDTKDVIAIGVLQAHTECLFYLLLAGSHAEAGVLRGAGKSVVPMVTMLSFWCVFRVIYITIATKFFPVITTIFWAYPITWTLSFIALTIYLGVHIKKLNKEAENV